MIHGNTYCVSESNVFVQAGKQTFGYQKLLMKLLEMIKGFSEEETGEKGMNRVSILSDQNH